MQLGNVHMAYLIKNSLDLLVKNHQREFLFYLIFRKPDFFSNVFHLLDD